MTFQQEIDKFVLENIKIVSFVVFIVSMMFWRIALAETLLFVIGYLIYVITLKRHTKIDAV